MSAPLYGLVELLTLILKRMLCGYFPGIVISREPRLLGVPFHARNTDYQLCESPESTFDAPLVSAPTFTFRAYRPSMHRINRFSCAPWTRSYISTSFQV